MLIQTIPDLPSVPAEYPDRLFAETEFADLEFRFVKKDRTERKEIPHVEDFPVRKNVEPAAVVVPELRHPAVGF